MQSFNESFENICIWISDFLGSKFCLLIFVLISVVPLFLQLPKTPIDWQQWLSQTFLQLVLLSILQKGTQVEGSKSTKLLQETHDLVMAEINEIHEVHKEILAILHTRK